MSENNLLEAEQALNSGQYDICFNKCKKIITEGNKSSKAYSLLGKAVFLKGDDITTAEKAFVQACQLDPSNPSVYSDLNLLFDRQLTSL